ncbi:MAG: pyrroline-5-carboxylate reductase [Erysipelotrichaceae bacterium]|nr:pyrroline-5-carboxylate reductase [Erysipelotrichaceae bacterium]
MNIGFIGAGNMATAMIHGLLQAKWTTPDHLWISNRSQGKLDAFAGCHTTVKNTEVAEHADILVLAIKPQIYQTVLKEIASSCKEDVLLVSIAPNWTLDSLSQTLGRPFKVARCMPNTPAMVGQGMSAVVFNSLCRKSDEDNLISFCQSFGQCVKVKEEQMELVVALSGSSPAYAFSFLNAMIEKGVQCGLDKKTSQLLSAQALKGAAEMVLQSEESAGQLKQNVCSPNGTTIEAVNVLDANGFEEILSEAMDACIQKARSMKV